WLEPHRLARHAGREEGTTTDARTPSALVLVVAVWALEEWNLRGLCSHCCSRAVGTSRSGRAASPCITREVGDRGLKATYEVSGPSRASTKSTTCSLVLTAHSLSQRRPHARQR